MAQTARSFVLKNSEDGESELTVYLPQIRLGVPSSTVLAVDIRIWP
jgi:hypothetical protein